MFPIILIMALAAPVVSTGAVVSGNQQPFCEKVLLGKYEPTGPDSNLCPGGKWSNFIYLIKSETAQPK